MCVCIYMDSLFSYIFCFSLDICIKFDPFLHLISLGATSVCTSPASGQQNKRFSTVDIYTSVVSKAVGPLYLSRYWTKQSKGFSVSPTCQHMRKNEATITALEGPLCIFPKGSPSSTPCSLLGRLWLTDLLTPSVHLWCAAAAVRQSSHAVTCPSLVLQGDRQWPRGSNGHWMYGQRQMPMCGWERSAYPE